MSNAGHFTSSSRPSSRSRPAAMSVQALCAAEHADGFLAGMSTSRTIVALICSNPGTMAQGSDYIAKVILQHLDREMAERSDAL